MNRIGINISEDLILALFNLANLVSSLKLCYAKKKIPIGYNVLYNIIIKIAKIMSR